VQSQHFTLLHALTSCQALRRVMPFLRDPKESLSAYWNSVCAAWLTISFGGFVAGKDSAPESATEWKEVLTKAPESGRTLEHTVKLVYACWTESRDTKNDRYRAVAVRELGRPSPFM
jgi:hypothetical protein